VAAPAKAPALTYRNGPLLTAVQVFTIFWGSAWRQAEAAQAQELNAFFDFVLTSPLIDQLAEYSVSGQTIGQGSRVGTLTLTSPEPAQAVSDADIQQLLRDQIAAGALPAAGQDSLYFVYLPPGVTVSAFGSSSCASFCGYHDRMDGQVYYAVMPHPDCTGCVGGLDSLSALTSTSSHELCEAITDPVPGQGWYDDSNGEIGDICAWQVKQLGQYTVQLEWSNKQGACV